MKGKNPREWVDWYVQHGGSRDLEQLDDEITLFHKEHGFISFVIRDNILELHHMVGDGKYWQQVIIKIMKLANLDKIRAFTKRNPKAWARKYGGHIIGYYMECDLNEIKI